MIFFQNVQNFMQIQKIELKILKMFLVLEIIASQVVVINYPYYYEKTCSW